MMPAISEKLKVWLLFAIALIARLIALPFSQIVEADATSRLFMAEASLANGFETQNLQWQSLHINFLSVAQFISGDRVWGPVILSLLMGAAAIIPFYLFTRNIFNRNGAFYAALIFSFSPLVFRMSFVPLSEIYYVFFTCLSLWFLSEGIIGTKKIKWALLSGLAITFACGARFEPWLLAALFGCILLLLKEWKMFFVFGTAAALFPVYWLVLCYVKTGNPLESIDLIADQSMILGKRLKEMDPVLYYRRIIFFPLSFLIAVTPLVALVIFAMLPRIIRSFRTNKARLLFSLLFIGMFIFSIRNSMGGMLANQHRYTITLAMLAIPLWAVWFENEKRFRLKQLVSLAIVLLLIPWSFHWHLHRWQKYNFGNNDIKNAFSHIVSGTFREIQAVPQLEQPEFIEIAARVKTELKKEDGYFIDWCDWSNSYYLLQQSTTANGKTTLFCTDGTDSLDIGRLNFAWENDPHGLILLSDLSLLSKKAELYGSLMQIPGMKRGLLLKPVFTRAHYRLFRYDYLSPEETEIQRQTLNFAPPLYRIEKDVAWYQVAILHNLGWYAAVWELALQNRNSLEKQTKLACEYQVEQDKLNEHKNDTLK